MVGENAAIGGRLLAIMTCGWCAERAGVAAYRSGDTELRAIALVLAAAFVIVAAVLFVELKSYARTSARRQGRDKKDPSVPENVMRDVERRMENNEDG